LDLDAPLARVWPAYAANGKSRTTLRDALSHRAAQPAFPDGLRTQELYDAPLLEAALARAAPEWDPGTAPAEHALTYGHVLSGTVRAVTGQGLGDVFRDAVARPLGLDAHFGVPAIAMARVADLELSTPDWPAATAGAPGSLRWRALTRPPGALDPAVLNGRNWRVGEFPAIGLHATAASIARFYGELVDSSGPVAALIGQELYRAFLDPAVTARDRLLDREVTWSLGLQVDQYGAGMAGIGGCDAYADTRHGFGYAYLTHRLADHSRSERILASLKSLLS